jgi:dipeptidyl aminopeptidase/acylaminoacyl peptidase
MENILLNNKLLKNIREITFNDFKDLITDPNQKQLIEDNSGKIRVFKFLYNVDSCDVVGFIVIPKNINLSRKNRTIICLRGGSNDFGAMKMGMFFNENSYFSWLPLNGYVTLYTQYRGNAGGAGKDEFGGKDLNDVKYLNKIIKTLNFCDKDKIGMLGWSRGAQMIYQLLKTEKWIKSAVCIAGPTDHVRMIKENFRSEWKEHLIKMYGGAMNETRKRSALYWAEKIIPIPLLIIHGTTDDKIDVRDSVDLHKKLSHSSLKLFKNDGHDLAHNKDKVKKLCLNWFKKTL